MKTKRPAKLIASAQKNITIIRENVPVMALAGIAFIGSYGHIVQLFGDYGLHGWDKYAAAATVDLLCIIGAEERQRDKRIGRSRRRGFVSWPMIVLIIGICATLAANLATAVPDVLGYCSAGWSAVALLLAVSILERRASHEAPLRIQEPASRAAPADTKAIPGTGTRPGSAGQRGSGDAGRHKGGTAVPRQRTKDPEVQAAEAVTHAEAELILAAEPGISGSDLGRRLGTTPGYGRTLKRKLAPVNSEGGS